VTRVNKPLEARSEGDKWYQERKKDLRFAEKECPKMEKEAMVSHKNFH